MPTVRAHGACPARNIAPAPRTALHPRNCATPPRGTRRSTPLIRRVRSGAKVLAVGYEFHARALFARDVGHSMTSSFMCHSRMPKMSLTLDCTLPRTAGVLNIDQGRLKNKLYSNPTSLHRARSHSSITESRNSESWHELWHRNVGRRRSRARTLIQTLPRRRPHRPLTWRNRPLRQWRSGSPQRTTTWVDTMTATRSWSS